MREASFRCLTMRTGRGVLQLSYSPSILLASDVATRCQFAQEGIMGLFSRHSSLARVLAFAFGILLCNGCAGVHRDAVAASAAHAYTPSPGDHTLGNPNAPVVLIQYDAPTCPHCAATLAGSFPHIKADYIDTGKLFYVYRIFPLRRLDEQVESVARCLPAEKYFPFMASVLQQQANWAPSYVAKDPRDELATLARAAGLGDRDFDRCFTDAETLSRIEKEGLAAGAPFGINGVPTFVINGQASQGDQGWPLLRDKIEAALAAP
jgi:protein-disulfide isomerase